MEEAIECQLIFTKEDEMINLTNSYDVEAMTT